MSARINLPQTKELQLIIRQADPTWVSNLLTPLQKTDVVVQDELPSLAQKYWTMLVILDQQLLQLHRGLTLAFSDLEKEGWNPESMHAIAVHVALQRLLDRVNSVLFSFQMLYELLFRTIEDKIGPPQTGKVFDVRQGFCLVETDAATPRSLHGRDMIKELVGTREDIVEIVLI